MKARHEVESAESSEGIAVVIPEASLAKKLATAIQEWAEEVESRAAEVGEFILTEAAEIDESGLGSRQREIVQALRGADLAGMKPAEIAATIGYEVTNVYPSLKTLGDIGLAERVPGANPQRWRLASKYRLSAPPFVRAAELVQEGEWTTFGDISIAVLGHTRSAGAIEQLFACLHHSPTRHRLLRAGGQIPSRWTSSADVGAAEFHRRLEAEGVAFDNDRPDPARRVCWDTLIHRGTCASNDPDASDEIGLESQVTPESRDHHLGRVQRLAVEALLGACNEGLTATQVSNAIGRPSLTNIYSLLRALVRGRVVQLVPGAHPRRWRISGRHRSGLRAHEEPRS